jgi:hypothetical protein
MCSVVYHIIYHIISYRIVSYRIISYHIISYHIISYHISYIISYHIIYHIIISYHIISYRIVSYRIISYHISYILKRVILWNHVECLLTSNFSEGVCSLHLYGCPLSTLFAVYCEERGSKIARNVICSFSTCILSCTNFFDFLNLLISLPRNLCDRLPIYVIYLKFCSNKFHKVGFFFFFMGAEPGPCSPDALRPVGLLCIAWFSSPRHLQRRSTSKDVRDLC